MSFDLTVSVINAKAEVAALAVEGAESNRLANAVNRLAEAEGRQSAVARLAAAEEFGASDSEIEAEALSILLRGADDTWSGRTNDAKRAFFDGVRDAIESLKRSQFKPSARGWKVS